MSQASNWTIANGGGAAVRAALNAIVAVLQSSSSGPAAPSPTVAGMLWFDTTNLVLKVRNNVNSGWLTVTPETIAANSLWGNPTGAAGALQAISMATLKTMLGFSQSLAASGYQVLPSGLIVQWGGGTTTTSGVTVTFPTAFSAQMRFTATPNAASAAMTTYQSPTLTSVLVQGWNAAGSQVALGFSWVAIGY